MYLVKNIIAAKVACLLFTVFAICFGYSGHAQLLAAQGSYHPAGAGGKAAPQAGNQSNGSPAVLQDSVPNRSIWGFRDTLFWLEKSTCKSFTLVTYPGLPLDRGTRAIGSSGYSRAPVQQGRIPTPLLRVHGHVHYDFLYRSYVDTPFAQRDFQQHTVQSYLNITVKDRYPLNLNVSKRWSNSPYFQNYFDVQAQFDRSAYLRTEKQRLMDKLTSQAIHHPDLAGAQAALQEVLAAYQLLKSWLNGEEVAQRVVEERERRYYSELTRKVGVKPLPVLEAVDLDPILRYRGRGPRLLTEQIPSPDSSYHHYAAQKKRELDSLEQNLRRLQAKADSLKSSLQQKLAIIKQKVYNASSLQELQRIRSGEGVGEEEQRRLDAFLTRIKTLGIGRSLVNYSELTAWNVALTGLNVEYNSGLYAAVAAGKIDFGFRDFLGRNSRKMGQQLWMGRVGLGDKERRAVILSAFTGKKYPYGSTPADSITRHVNVLGYSLEAIMKRNEHTGVIVELAKTTRPVSGNFRVNREWKSLLDYGNDANLGLSVKGQTLITETDTKLSGFFRKAGEHFQSFSLFSYQTDQTAWALKMEQPFFGDKVSVVTQLRRNDFTNPYTEKTFKTSTVFKSVQFQVRFPKWPVFSGGYYPGTQLYMIDRERVRENVYYIMNGSLVHQYTAGRLRLLSSLIYNRYSNKGTDSGFIAYEGVNYLAAQSLILPKLQVHASYSYTDQEQMQFYTLEAGADCTVFSRLKIGIGGNYNKVQTGKEYLGSRAQLELDVTPLGTLQVQYDKSYLPTIHRALFAVEVGRVSWFKYF